MKTIKAHLPEKPEECFFYVGPPPVKDKIDLLGQQMIFESAGETQKVELIDFLIYRANQIPQIICYASYGMSKEQMLAWLQRKFRMRPEDKVAFYQFRILKK